MYVKRRVRETNFVVHHFNYLKPIVVHHFNYLKPGVLYEVSGQTNECNVYHDPTSSPSMTAAAMSIAALWFPP